MRLLTLTLLFLPLTLAATTPPLLPRAPPTNNGACKPNAFETFNLQHHHDINTGDIIVGSTVRHSGIKPGGGSGCSPIWAGGSYDDSSMFPGGSYPAWIKAKEGGGAESGAKAKGLKGVGGL
ncbi:hypothetical protein EJ06DRAFT_582908 [Trichodelitschia bisporula]|uniref:Uncharacterized protein n=1 Tax=Trichodelitschia bisporula TaxID=703511 RepID=A0A6G1HUH4_9PEZI|nr:hypothetical protein EJ06DRAFT_582908 [Trichodelitschia bisporula]